MQEAANLGNQSVRLSEAMPSKWPHIREIFFAATAYKGQLLAIGNAG